MNHRSRFFDLLMVIGASVKDFVIDRVIDLTYSPNFKPRVDIVQEGEVYHLKSDMPGVEKDDLSITIEKDVLTIHGKRVLPLHQNEHFDHSERKYGSFTRSIKVPHHVDPTEITAYLRNGVLDIALKKSEQEETRRYTVDVF